MKGLRKLTHKIVATLTMAALTQGSAGVSWAATISDVSDNVKSSVATTPTLLNAVCYLSASVLSVAGFYGIKQHSDAPQNVPLKNGVAKLAAGGALFSAPYVAAVVQETIRAGDTSTAAQQNIINAAPSY